MEITVKWHGAEYEKNLKLILQKKLNQAAEETKNHIKEKISGGRRGSIGTGAQGEGYPPRVDTGQLRNSIFWDKQGEFTRRIGTTLPYGLYLELGADIRPKKGKFLAIPFSQEAKQHSRGGGSARNFPKRLRRVGRNPNTFLLVEDVGGKRARGVIHYIITKHARLRMHPFLRPSLEEMRPELNRIFNTPV